MSDEINDPTVMKPYDSYSDEDDNQEDATSEYLNILYKDYKTKIDSATIYLKKIKEQENMMDGIVHEWTAALKNKYEILNDFQQSRPKTSIPGDFATEDVSEPVEGSASDLKSVDSKITDHSEQINFRFKKIEKYLQFLGTTFLDAQDTVNSIYNRYMEMYNNM